MTCPGGMECSCTYQTRTVWPRVLTSGLHGTPGLTEEVIHAYSGLLPQLGWWRWAVEREFEGAARAELRVRDIQFVTGLARFDDGWMALPMMAAASEVRAYGRYWRERIMRARMGEPLP